MVARWAAVLLTGIALLFASGCKKDEDTSGTGPTQGPPPPELVDWASQDLGANVKPLTSDEWTGLLENAGLKEIVNKISELSVKDETKGIFRRYGFGGMMRIIFRMFSLFARSSAYRKFVKEVKQKGVAPKNLNEYFGYGIYVGKK